MKQFKKKVARITGILILSLGLFISPLFVPVYAGTNIWDYNFVYTANNVRATASGYGCVYDDYYASNSNSNTRFKHVITINFNEIVSGTVNLTFNFERGDIVLTENCTVEFYAASSTAGFGLRVNNVSWCKVEVYTQSDARYLMDMTHNCSVSTDSDNAYLGTMLNIFQDSTYGFRAMAIDVQNIWSCLSNPDGNVIQALQNIESMMSNDYDDYLSSLLTLWDQDTGLGYLQEIYQAVSNLNIPDQSSYFTSLIGLITNTNGYIDGLETTCSNIYTRLGSINTSLTAISTSLQTSMHTNLDIPRWQLLAYRWAVSVGYVSGQYSTWSATTSTGWLNRYTNPDGDHQFTPAKGHYLQSGTSSQPNSRKYIIAWASTSANNGSTYDIYWSNEYSSGWHADCYYGNSTNGGYRDGVYFNYVIVYNNYTPSASNRGFEIEFNNRIYISPIYVGYLDVMPDEACALLGFQKTDQLLEAAQSYFSDSLDLLQQIVDGIAGISTTQTVIDAADQVNIDFNTVMNNVNNVEVNLLNGIDTKFSDVNTSVSDSNVLSQFVVIQTAKSWADLMIGHIFYWLNPIKYPIYIVLIGFVLLCLLG